MPGADIFDQGRTGPSREAGREARIGKGVRLKKTQTVVQSLRKARPPVTGLRREEAGRAPIVREDGYIIALQLGDVFPHELWVDGRLVTVPPSPNGAMVYLNVEPPAADPGSPSDTLKFYVPRVSPAEIAAAADLDRFETLHLHPGDILFDAVVARFGTCLLSALEQPEQASGLFVGYVALALIAYIVHTYREARVGPGLVRGGLAPWQERRAKQILSENLDGKVTLALLASECGLSIGHFARAFKRTTGHPPHRWLMAQRVEQAKKLLSWSALPLADIAVDCGFADQSHFTHVFSQMVGTGPGAWRRARTIDRAGAHPSCAHDTRSARD